jgi:hypothetical protein
MRRALCQAWLPLKLYSKTPPSISLGMLAGVLPDPIEDVLEETGRREQRSRRLPAHVTIRFCLAMCLFMMITRK